MPNISKETIICMSLASRPSNFGVTIHNRAFEHLGLDAVYLARGIPPLDEGLRDAIYGIKALGIRGCGVSMPFKEESMKYVDLLDSSAIEVGAINTIVNENGVLVGHNTDFYGAREVLRRIEDIKTKSVLVIGAGGVSRAICAALISLGVSRLFITNRDAEKATYLARRWNSNALLWKDRNNINADIIINATSIGMNPYQNALPVEIEAIDNFKIFYDVVINPVDTLFLKIAEKKTKTIIYGSEMCLFQAAKQFELYTGEVAPIAAMREAMYSLLSST